MRLLKTSTLAGFAAMAVLAAGPAVAQSNDQDQHGRDRRGGQATGQARERGGEARGQTAERSGEARGQTAERGGEARSQTGERSGEARGQTAERSGQVRDQGGERASRGMWGGEQRDRGEAVERRGGDQRDRGTVVAPRYGGRAEGEYRSRGYVEPRGYRYVRPRAVIPIVPYRRPYYSFHPRYRIGYGIFLGYPVPYPLDYGYPSYVYGYPYPYDEDELPPPNGTVMTQPPAQGTYGGVSFDISPDDAAVVVDGTYMGIARDFSPMYQPLTVTPGRHHIELQAPGMIPLAFDVDVQPGQVLPYRGDLQPQ